MDGEFKPRYYQPGTIRNNYYKNSDIITDFNEAYFDHIILQDHRRAKYKEKNRLKEKSEKEYN
ncbi:MAG: hypothetical protein PHX15_01500 [Candidatus Nanoarchaeia archaeon]|jgi:hypothetical protein|nr:hypothetical protein [Candidatus Nanoarchaeia archaeon]MDD3993851.1 hypothetical protein [Candidatus Nanoarchaeia archaeon]MDD4563637.1 hypothetical protein [Candidatus Nanoarchaeia archaeon]